MTSYTGPKYGFEDNQDELLDEEDAEQKESDADEFKGGEGEQTESESDAAEELSPTSRALKGTASRTTPIKPRKRAAAAPARPATLRKLSGKRSTPSSVKNLTPNSRAKSQISKTARQPKSPAKSRQPPAPQSRDRQSQAQSRAPRSPKAQSPRLQSPRPQSPRPQNQSIPRTSRQTRSQSLLPSTPRKPTDDLAAGLQTPETLGHSPCSDKTLGLDVSPRSPPML